MLPVWEFVSWLGWSGFARWVWNAVCWTSTLLTCLHAHETAPDEDAAAVQESRDDVASQQGDVGPRFADVGCEVVVQSSCQGCFGILLMRRFSEQRGTFCVDFIRGESILRDRVVSRLRGGRHGYKYQLETGLVCPPASDMSKSHNELLYFFCFASCFLLHAALIDHPTSSPTSLTTNLPKPSSPQSPMQYVVVERVNRSLRLSRRPYSSPPQTRAISTSALADRAQLTKVDRFVAWLR